MAIAASRDRLLHVCRASGIYACGELRLLQHCRSSEERAASLCAVYPFGAARPRSSGTRLALGGCRSSASAVCAWGCGSVPCTYRAVRRVYTN